MKHNDNGNPNSKKDKGAKKDSVDEIEKFEIEKRGYIDDTGSDSEEEREAGIRKTEGIVLRKKKNPEEKDKVIAKIKIKKDSYLKYYTEEDPNTALRKRKIRDIQFIKTKQIFLLKFNDLNYIQLISGVAPYEEIGIIPVKDNGLESSFTSFIDSCNRIWVVISNDFNLISPNFLQIDTYISNSESHEENQDQEESKEYEEEYPLEMFERSNETYIINYGKSIKILTNEFTTDSIIKYYSEKYFYIHTMIKWDEDSFLAVISTSSETKLVRYNFQFKKWIKCRILGPINKTDADLSEHFLKFKQDFIFWFAFYDDIFIFQKYFRIQKIFTEGMILLNDIIVEGPETEWYFNLYNLVDERISFLFGNIVIYYGHEVWFISGDMKYFKRFEFPQEEMEERKDIATFMDGTSIAMLCKDKSVKIFKLEDENQKKDN